MTLTLANIERIAHVSNDYQQLSLAFDADFPVVKPGHSLLVRPDDDLSPTWHPYLRQTWYPVSSDIKQRLLIVERPRTEHYEVSQTLSVLGPIGQPFRFRRTLREVRLIAYDTPPHPLLYAIPWLLTNRVSVSLILLGVAAGYDTRHIAPEVEVIKGGEAFAWQDQLLSLGNADHVFLAVNRNDELTHFYEAFLRIRELREIPKNFLFGVFQLAQPCGMSACHACMIRTAQGQSLICAEGPAYDLTQVKFQ